MKRKLIVKLHKEIDYNKIFKSEFNKVTRILRKEGFKYPRKRNLFKENLMSDLFMKEYSNEGDMIQLVKNIFQELDYVLSPGYNIEHIRYDLPNNVPSKDHNKYLYFEDLKYDDSYGYSGSSFSLVKWDEDKECLFYVLGRLVKVRIIGDSYYDLKTAYVMYMTEYGLKTKGGLLYDTDLYNKLDLNNISVTDFSSRMQSKSGLTKSFK